MANILILKTCYETFVLVPGLKNRHNGNAFFIRLNILIYILASFLLLFLHFSSLLVNYCDHVISPLLTSSRAYSSIIATHFY